MFSSFYVCCIYIQVHFRLDFHMEENNMNPDQIAPLGPYCLSYRLAKKRRTEDKSRLGGLRFYISFVKKWKKFEIAICCKFSIAL